MSKEVVWERIAELKCRVKGRSLIWQRTLFCSCVDTWVLPSSERAEQSYQFCFYSGHKATDVQIFFDIPVLLSCHFCIPFSRVCWKELAVDAVDFERLEFVERKISPSLLHN